MLAETPCEVLCGAASSTFRTLLRFLRRNHSGDDYVTELSDGIVDAASIRATMAVGLYSTSWPQRQYSRLQFVAQLS